MWYQGQRKGGGPGAIVLVKAEERDHHFLIQAIGFVHKNSQSNKHKGRSFLSVRYPTGLQDIVERPSSLWLSWFILGHSPWLAQT